MKAAIAGPRVRSVWCNTMKTDRPCKTAKTSHSAFFDIKHSIQVRWINLWREVRQMNFLFWNWCPDTKWDLISVYNLILQFNLPVRTSSLNFNLPEWKSNGSKQYIDHNNSKISTSPSGQVGWKSTRPKPKSTRHGRADECSDIHCNIYYFVNVIDVRPSSEPAIGFANYLILVVMQLSSKKTSEMKYLHARCLNYTYLIKDLLIWKQSTTNLLKRIWN